MYKLLVPVVVLLIALGATVLTDRPREPADFAFVNRGDVATLDLQRMSWMQDLRVARILFEGLVKNDVFSHDYRALPGVAERWEVSGDGRVYTFHLRGDAKWSDGAPVTSRDFKYAWRRALLPDIGADYTKQFQLIEGARAFYEWRTGALEALSGAGASQQESETAKQRDSETGAGRGRATERRSDGGEDGGGRAPGLALWDETLRKFDELVGIETPDDRTLIVTLERPTPYFLSLCAFAVFFPVYPPLVERYETVHPATGRLASESGWTKPPLLVSNGPFKLVEWRFKRDLRLERNEHYWDQGSINIDSILIPSVEDPNAQVLSFDSGAVDWVSDVTPPYRAGMLAAKRAYYREHGEAYESLVRQGLDPVEIDRRLPPDPRQNIHAFPAFGTYFYNFNCLPTLPDGRDNPFADPRVRRAFAMAIDKRTIVEQVRRTGERVTATLIPPGSLPGYASPRGLAYDPAAARRLLAEAGYPGGRGFITVEILFNRDGGHDSIAQAIKKDWEENLGVKVTLAQKEIKVFRNDLKEHDFMVSRAGWFGDYPDPLTFLEINKTGDENNDRSYSNPEYDALLDAAVAEPDPAARLRLLEQAETILAEEGLPLIPIFQYVQVYLFDPHKLSGISAHPRQEQNLYLVDVLGDGKGAETPRALPPQSPDGAGEAGRTGG